MCSVVLQGPFLLPVPCRLKAKSSAGGVARGRQTLLPKQMSRACFPTAPCRRTQRFAPCGRTVHFGCVALLSDASSVIAGGAVKGHCQCRFCVQVSGLNEMVPSGSEISKGRLLYSVNAYSVLRRL